MKTLLFGLTLFVGGIIGSLGWIIANVLIIEPGGVSSISSALHSSPFGFPITIGFILMSIIGLIISLYILLSHSNKH